MIAYIELGILFSDYNLDKVIVKNRKLFFSCTFILTLLGFYFSMLNGATGPEVCNYGNYPVLYILTSILLSFAAIIIAVLIDNNIIFEYIGRWSMCILLMHKFPILVVREIIPITKSMFADNVPDSILTLFCGIIISLICILLCLAVGRIICLISPQLIGQKQSVKATLNSDPGNF